MQENQAETFKLGFSEQFTHFGTLKLNGDTISNEAHQSLDSSITQLFLNYDVTNQVGLQITVPIIVRSFKRPEDAMIRSGRESGLGDIALVGNFSPYRFKQRDLLLNWNLKGGVKIPSGDHDRLREETEEEQHFETSRIQQLQHSGHHAHEELVSGIHGHDLTLGSGSFDYVIGTNVFVGKGRAFLSTNVQYAIRTEGAFDYRFANDLLWDFGPGAYLILTHETTLALKANLSGEAKGMDVFRGNKAEDTGITSMFLGPQLLFTAQNQWTGGLGFDLPLLLDNTALQVVPDYRIRVSLSYCF